MKKWLKWIGIGLAVLFFGAQVVRPARTNPETNPSQTIHALTQITPEAAAVLERSCRDCHSNETRWPWYAHVAPVSWWVIDHVNHGRSHFNYSQWGKVEPKEAGRLRNQICVLVENGEMPLPVYLPMHPGARLSEEDKRALCQWAKGGGEGVPRQRSE